MSAPYILLAGMLIAIPVAIKYFLAFEVRNLLENLKARERDVESLAARLEAVQREKEVVGNATRHVIEQRQWAQRRRGLMRAELATLRRIPAVAPIDEFEATPWADSSLAWTTAE